MSVLLRVLLQRLPQLCELPRASRLEGLSVGLGASEQAQLAEQGGLKDPAGFVARLNKLLLA